MLEIIDAVGPWLVGAVIYGLPFWLAWWLTDGFEGWEWVDYSPQIEYGHVCDPRTGRTIIAPIDVETGFPIAYPYS